MLTKRAFLYTTCLSVISLYTTACATIPQPAVEIRTVEVPVPVACLSAEQLAQMPEPPLVGDQLGRTPETAEADRDILGASALLLRAWGRELFAAHAGCAEVES